MSTNLKPKNVFLVHWAVLTIKIVDDFTLKIVFFNVKFSFKNMQGLLKFYKYIKYIFYKTF